MEEKSQNITDNRSHTNDENLRVKITVEENSDKITDSKSHTYDENHIPKDILMYNTQFEHCLSNQSNLYNSKVLFFEY